MPSSSAFISAPLHGRLTVPGDKSISHRALLLAASSPAPVRVNHLNLGGDVRATRYALEAMGAAIAGAADSVAVSRGVLRSPAGQVDCANSGSTARMLMGVCAGANLRARFDGDESLRRRSMEPAAAQLRAFGARIETTNGTLPATVSGTPQPQTRRFILLAPSAQVKTALLLAGVYGGVAIEILGDKGSRDHTERLLRYFGSDIDFDASAVRMRTPPRLFRDVDVPGDFSAAAFFIVAATVACESAIEIERVGVNPTRTGLLDALRGMGADIRLERQREISGEPVADIVVRSARLRAANVSPDVTLRAIDEIPVLAVAAAFASGTTRIDGVRELRDKESDRVASIERLLSAVGIAVETVNNGSGIAIYGGNPKANATAVSTGGDHRIAMSAAALAAGAGALAVDDEACITVSFPNFISTLQKAQSA